MRREQEGIHVHAIARGHTHEETARGHTHVHAHTRTQVYEGLARSGAAYAVVSNRCVHMFTDVCASSRVSTGVDTLVRP